MSIGVLGFIITLSLTGNVRMAFFRVSTIQY